MPSFYQTTTTILSLLSTLLPSPIAAAPTPAPLTNFLLITTTSPNPCTNTSTLPNVSATSLFDPLDQTPFLLRLIGPGYDSLPRFNLSSSNANASLTTLTEGPEGFGEYVYTSIPPMQGAELTFLPPGAGKAVGGNGTLGLRGGFLLTVDGVAEGWAVCAGPEGEQVIAWKNSTTGCVDTYIQAVAKAPY